MAEALDRSDAGPMGRSRHAAQIEERRRQVVSPGTEIFETPNPWGPKGKGLWP
jgi:hypothetical protein